VPAPRVLIGRVPGVEPDFFSGTNSIDATLMFQDDRWSLAQMASWFFLESTY